MSLIIRLKSVRREGCGDDRLRRQRRDVRPRRQRRDERRRQRRRWRSRSANVKGLNFEGAVMFEL